MSKELKSTGIYYIESRGRYSGQVRAEIFGVPKTKTFYGRTEKEVKRKMRDFESKVRMGEYKLCNKVTLGSLAEEMIEDQYALNEVSESTYARKLETFKKLKPLADILIVDITEDMLKRFMVKQINYSQSIINKIFQMLKATLDEAVRKKIISENPMVCIRKPKSRQEKVKVRSLTVEEQTKLLKVLKTEDILYSQQMLLSMFTGMRMGEVNALEVNDIDFKQGIIRVNKTVAHSKYRPCYINKRTKTAAGMRRLKVNDEILDFLRDCIGDKTEGRIFSTRTGDIVSTGLVNYKYRDVLKKYDIVDEFIDGKVDLHSLRHTYATRCIEGGMPPKVLQKILGHTDITVTLNTYCDTFDPFADENIAKADEYMRNNNLSIA